MKPGDTESMEETLDELEDLDQESIDVSSLESWDEAVSSLPPYCEDSVELDWIRAHPAMSRRSRYAALGVHEPVVITVEDILSPPHGSAPSQTAAQALQHWVNNPDKFFDRVITEQRKRMDAARQAKKEEEEVDDVSEIQQMIDDVVRGIEIKEQKALEQPSDQTLECIGK